MNTESTNLPRIAIPMPHSTDHDYAERSILQYERAVEQAGGLPVRIPLDRPFPEIQQIIERCDAVLLPGSGADVDPAKFNAARSLRNAAPDATREAVDQLLLDDAYNLHKPILGICYGLQSLNVYHKGSLIQHIPDFLPEALRARVDHEAGRKVAIAHEVEIEKKSKLAEILCGDSCPRLLSGAQLRRESTAAPEENREGHDFSRAHTAVENGALAPAGKLKLAVNSSHHQSADAIGDGLLISARCPDDGIIEAIEGTDHDHFVMAVQWHPERSVDQDQASRAIFRSLIEAAGG